MIEYSVIYRDEDLEAVREFLSEVDESGRENCPITYPTIVAKEAEDIVGCFTTRDDDQAVMVGPVEAQGRRFVLLRMAEAYDYVMRQHGIKEYLVPVDKRYPDIMRVMEKLFGPPYAYDADHAWFRRTL